ncbi:hypothetical protein BXY41_11645 [Lacrimispora xylanisolvens]|uniref:Uncharacterized protein n=1 Tax=Lacrimispora xylanisolvens TaxID=384636 RepID=A0A2S6HJ73_9FIRM|nr:hypothetical protein [Hungatella xylanolytica]PPK77507.1 hypothetical protein BXY41_11645 [Hungatella xylanolytica]
MEKILFCNLDLLRLSFTNYDKIEHEKKVYNFLEYANELCTADENKIFFVSRDLSQLNAAKNFFNKRGFINLKFCVRSKVRDFISQHKTKNHFFVFVSGKEVDFHLAVLSHSLFIVPTWIPVEDKAEFYGVHVDTPKQLFKFIKTLNNQESWYAELEIEPNVKALSLMDGRYKYKAKTDSEREMVEHFESLLKRVQVEIITLFYFTTF